MFAMSLLLMRDLGGSPTRMHVAYLLQHHCVHAMLHPEALAILELPAEQVLEGFQAFLRYGNPAPGAGLSVTSQQREVSAYSWLVFRARY